MPFQKEIMRRFRKMGGAFFLEEKEGPADGRFYLDIKKRLCYNVKSQ